MDERQLEQINEEHKKINGELRHNIKSALNEIDELQQAIFGLEDKMWIYYALENVVNRLKGDSNE